MDKEDMEYVYNAMLLSHKKIEIMPFAVTWMYLEIIILREVRKRKIPYDITVSGIWNMT